MTNKRTAAEWLDSFDWGEYEDVEGCSGRWLDDAEKKLNVNSRSELTSSKFLTSRITKETMSYMLSDARALLERQLDVMETFKDMIDLMKTEALIDKSKVIEAQEKLLECHDMQLKSVKLAVESTVQSSVQQEIKSYSEAVMKKSSETVVTEKSLKSVVRSAIEDEDRSKNLIIFGLTEQDGEKLDSKVIDMLSDLNEKPRVSTSRIGLKRNDKPADNSGCRPVKVKLASSTIAHQILQKARNLRNLDKYKSVYICPDRSPENRAARRALVLELKAASESQPDKNFYIKHGKVVSVEK